MFLQISFTFLLRYIQDSLPVMILSRDTEDRSRSCNIECAHLGRRASSATLRANLVRRPWYIYNIYVVYISPLLSKLSGRPVISSSSAPNRTQFYSLRSSRDAQQTVCDRFSSSIIARRVLRRHRVTYLLLYVCIFIVD